MNRDLMQSASAAATLDRPHDLPARWDGRRVEWGEWEPPAAVWICGRFTPHVCPQCGAQDAPSEALGMVRGDLDARTGIRPQRRLVAYRCPCCLRDEVLVVGTGEFWTLDPSDYTDIGSWDR